MKAIDKQKYEQLKSLLSYGDISRISKELNYCRGTVYNVLNGSSKNIKIMKKIIQLINQKMQILKEFENQYKKNK